MEERPRWAAPFQSGPHRVSFRAGAGLGSSRCPRNLELEILGVGGEQRTEAILARVKRVQRRCATCSNQHMPRFDSARTNVISTARTSPPPSDRLPPGTRSRVSGKPSTGPDEGGARRESAGSSQVLAPPLHLAASSLSSILSGDGLNPKDRSQLEAHTAQRGRKPSRSSARRASSRTCAPEVLSCSAPDRGGA